MARLVGLVCATLATAAAGCGGVDAATSSPAPSTDSIQTVSGLSVEYPADWQATLQRDMVYPGQSVLITSYPVGSSATYVEARDNRPPDGDLMLIMDIQPPDEYLQDAMLVPRPSYLTLGPESAFEGLGEGYRVAFTDSGHAVIVYATGDASSEPAMESILNSITVSN